VTPAARRLAAAFAVVASAGVPVATSAQALPLKRSIPLSATDVCVGVTAPPAVARPNGGDAPQYLRRAREAALLGDLQGTRTHLAAAAALDPRNAAIAFELARTLDDLGDRRAALAEYCRYLRLAPTAADAGGVQARVFALAPAAAPSSRRMAAAVFDSAVAHADAGRLEEAEEAFGRALAADSTAAEAYFDRGVVRAARKRRLAAGDDLQRYLALRREASDRVVIERQIDVLRTSPPNPAGALLSGIFIPGGGQFATRRPWSGVIVMAGVGGAAFWALQERERTVLRRFVDPFGNPYESLVREKERPNLVTGAAAAGGLMLTAALESYLRAKRTRAELEDRYLQFATVVVPSGAVVAATGVAVRFEIPWQLGRGGQSAH
jgi:tetratricopeptide (TPR) repeat protein